MLTYDPYGPIPDKPGHVVLKKQLKTFTYLFS